MNTSQAKFSISDKKKKEQFVSIFQLLKCSSSRIHLTMSHDEMHVQGMDKSHVCLFDLLLHKEWFNEYEVQNNKQLCFDTNTFCSIISTKSEEQQFNFYVDNENADIVHIQFLNIDAMGGKKPNHEYDKFFKLPLLEYDYEEMFIPSVEYDVSEMMLPSKKITDLLSQLSHFGDDLQIKCTDEWVDFTSSNDSIEMCVRVLIDDMSSYSIAFNEGGPYEINVVYSLIYVNKMCVSNKLSDEIEFNLSVEYPMKIFYNLGNKSSLYFYIAPKIVD